MRVKLIGTALHRKRDRLRGFENARTNLIVDLHAKLDGPSASADVVSSPRSGLPAQSLFQESLDESQFLRCSETIYALVMPDFDNSDHQRAWRFLKSVTIDAACVSSDNTNVELANID